MARVRLTFFFSGYNAGWSESIHSSLSPTDIPGLTSQVTAYTNARLSCLNASYSLIHTRVSDDETFRDILYNPTANAQPGIRTGAAANANSCCLIRIQSGTRIFRNFFMRGLTAADIQGNLFNLPNATATAINAWILLIKSGGYAISAKDPAILPTLETTYNTVSGLHTVLTDIASLAPYAKLSLTKVPRSQVPQRVWTVATAPTLKTFTLIDWPLLQDFSNKARWRLATPQLNAITDATREGISERRVGRPFGLQRGRAAPVR